MIRYNMRYRGPYEHDKFALNILQYHNMITNFKNDISSSMSWKTLYDMSNIVTQLFKDTCYEDGRSDKLYKKFIMMGD